MSATDATLPRDVQLDRRARVLVDEDPELRQLARTQGYNAAFRRALGRVERELAAADRPGQVRALVTEALATHGAKLTGAAQRDYFAHRLTAELEAQSGPPSIEQAASYRTLRELLPPAAPSTR